MFYYMPKKTHYNPPSKRYLNLIIQGYKDCGWNEKSPFKNYKKFKTSSILILEISSNAVHFFTI